MTELVLHIMDIVYNSIRACATLVTINIKVEGELLYITVLDNGSGIKAEDFEKVKNPFMTSRNTRKVGLGISLFELSAQNANGSLEIESEYGEYTKVSVVMEKNHINCLPMGDLGECIYLLSVADDNCEIRFVFENGEKQFVYDSREIKEIVGNDLKSNYEIITWVKEYINENI